MAKKHKYYLGFFVACLALAFFLTAGCRSDEYYDDYDSDPLRGGGSVICTDDISWLQVFTRAFGFYAFGFVAHHIIKEARAEEEQQRIEKITEIQKKWTEESDKKLGLDKKSKK